MLIPDEAPKQAKPANLLETLEPRVALGRAHQNGDAFSV